MADNDGQTKLSLVKRNLKELIGEKELVELLQSGKTPSVYIGTAITGKPHVGYFVWGVKMLDLMKAGFKVKVLLADVHGALDKTSWDLLEKRYQYYQKVITGMFESLGADLSKLEFIKGSSFQLTKEFMLDLLKLATAVTVHDSTKAASDVVKLGDKPKLGGLIYPLMQALDEEYLKVDAQYAGVDQRKIMVFARENLPKIGYKSRIEIMSPLIPGLQGPGAKMSASIPHSKIGLLEDEKTVKDKLAKAYCPEGVVEGNGVLALLKYVVMPIKEDSKEELIINRPEKFGGDMKIKEYSELEEAFSAKKLHPLDLKNALAREMNSLLGPIRKKMESEGKLISEAYPE